VRPQALTDNLQVALLPKQPVGAPGEAAGSDAAAQGGGPDIAAMMQQGGAEGARLPEAPAPQEAGPQGEQPPGSGQMTPQQIQQILGSLGRG
jgi:hypothetical protein